MTDQLKKLKEFAENTPNPAHIQVVFEVDPTDLDDELNSIKDNAEVEEII